jgi:uncharacterized alpha-E superfamily protein
MLSRVADSLYWMARYIERAENVARFIDVNVLLSLDGQSAGNQTQWLPVVETTGDTAWFLEHYKAANAANARKFLMFDPEYPNSIVSCLRAARENARATREVISSEMWEQLNTYYLMVRDAALQDEAGAPLASGFLTAVKQHSHLFAGITANTMSHNEAWHFIQLGRMLERADKTSRLLDVKYFMLLPSVQDVGSILDESQWAAVLRSASAFEMYRKKHGRITPRLVAEFLVLDREFPRAIHYCLHQADGALRAITGAALGTFANAAGQALGRLRAELDYASAADILKSGLHEFLDGLQTSMNGVGAALDEIYFNLHLPGTES